MIKAEHLVGVITPMYNAAQTIRQTLESVRRQTHAWLDIVVVDDGSSDASSEIVADQINHDSRIRLIQQANAGVAAARNRGAAVTKAQFLAFIDADDLWAPEKLSLQIATMAEAGNEVGLTYTWYAHIDEEGRTFAPNDQSTFEGNVLRDLCRRNFVGNGSSMLVRRAAFEAVGGFDPSLRTRDAQGYEDYLLCMRIAEQYEFRAVPRHLVGYRINPQSMSGNIMQMTKSCQIVLDEYQAKYPQYNCELTANMDDVLVWSIKRSLRTGRLSQAALLASRLYKRNPRLLLRRTPTFAESFLRSLDTARNLKSLLMKLQIVEAKGRPFYIEQKW